MSSEEAHKLNIFFLPLMAHGHLIPMADLAKQFAERGVKVSIITTHANASIIHRTIDRTKESGHMITLLLIRFPSVEAGLPEGCENLSAITSPELIANFSKAVDMLREPVELLLREHSPDYLISDVFLPWTEEIARTLGIPRLMFKGTCFFSHCIEEILVSRYENKSLETEAVIIPGLPHSIKMLRSQFPDFAGEQNQFREMVVRIKESELNSYGMVVNSFCELEPDYAEHYRKVFGRKAWHIGPVSLCNRSYMDKAMRGEKASVDHETCLRWLDSKEPSSVLYVCFGSWSWLTTAQLREIALGLEASNRSFIWVLRNDQSETSEWMHEGFEERIKKGKGLIIKGWAPQILILNHEAVGGFLTHCGWNSVLEGVSAGVPMITWPLFAEQFFNEKLIVDVLGIGVAVGAQIWSMQEEAKELIKGPAIAASVDRLMGSGEECDAMRKKARGFGEMARKAVEEGGSSYVDMSNLIQELSDLRNASLQPIC